MGWSLLARLQQEIDGKIGSRLPGGNWGPSTVGPAEKPVHIEKGTTLVTNLYVNQRDEQVWGRPMSSIRVGLMAPPRRCLPSAWASAPALARLWAAWRTTSIHSHDETVKIRLRKS